MINTMTASTRGSGRFASKVSGREVGRRAEARRREEGGSLPTNVSLLTWRTNANGHPRSGERAGEGLMTM